MNSFTLMGTLINTPEVKQITEKFRVAELLVSVKKPYSKFAKQGAPDSDTIQVRAINDKADFAASTLNVGNEVIIFGDINSREYNGKYYTEVNARNIHVCNSLEYAEQSRPIPPSEATRYQQPQQPFQVSDRDIPF